MSTASFSERQPHQGLFLVLLIALPVVAAGAALRAGSSATAQAKRPQNLAVPVEHGTWLLPARSDSAEPIWGIKNGIAVGLWPTPGPRGLFRIYAPYLGQPRLRMINYIAVEPIVAQRRGLSELEHSEHDNMPGKAMWSSARIEEAAQPRPPWEPAEPEFFEIDGVPALRFYVFVERFRSGAQPIIQVVLREDRPHEVAFRIFAAEGSTAMKSCILSATMGNYARLRRLWLRDQVVEPAQLWPGFESREPRLGGFAPHRAWGLEHLAQTDGEVVVAATPDEPDPSKAVYPENVAPWWRYEGRVATQYWRAKSQEQIVVRVNGRFTFWGSTAEIPGGVAYENFELEAPFLPAQEFRFGVSPDPPELVTGSDEG
jgi:hypothetical protein